MSGAFDGRIHFFDDIDGHLSSGDLFNLVSNSYGGIDVDAYSTVVLNDIDNNGESNLFVGQELGGIFHFIEGKASSIGLQELERNLLISLNPNPAEEKFTVRTEFGLIQSLEVWDLYGKQIYKCDVNSKTFDVYLTDFKKGIYVVRVNHSSGQTQIKRLVKQ